MINLDKIRTDKDGFVYYSQDTLDGVLFEYPDLRAAYKQLARCKTTSKITMNEWIHIASYGKAIRYSEITNKIYKNNKSNSPSRITEHRTSKKSIIREISIEMPILGLLACNNCYRLITNKNRFNRMNHRKNNMLVWVVEMPNWMIRKRLLRGML